jgi:hypothetical protein
MLEITYRQLQDSVEPLKKIVEIKNPAKVRALLLRNIKEIEAQLESFGKVYKELVLANALLDDNGEPKTEEGRVLLKDNGAKFQTELDGLLSTKISVNISLISNNDLVEEVTTALCLPISWMLELQ